MIRAAQWLEGLDADALRALASTWGTAPEALALTMAKYLKVRNWVANGMTGLELPALVPLASDLRITPPGSRTDVAPFSVLPGRRPTSVLARDRAGRQVEAVLPPSLSLTRRP